MKRIRSVKVETHEAGLTILGKGREKWKPSTKETADHSLPYIVAMALLTGKIDNSTYSETNLHDEANLEFIGRIRVVEDPAFSLKYPQEGMANRVTVTKAGGQEISAQVDIPKGHPRNPMSKQDIEAKFLHLATEKIGVKAAREALTRIWNFEDEKDLSGFIDILRVRRSSNA
jgi:2-methylcitrate dehydratase